MKAEQALRELYRQVGSIHYFDFSSDIPRETLTLLRNSGLFETLDDALKQLEEMKRVLEIVKHKIYCVNDEIRINPRRKIGRLNITKEDFKLLMEYLK